MKKHFKILFGMLLIAAVVVTVLFFANDMSFTTKEKSISINLLDGQGNPISENVVLTNPDYKDSDLTVVFDDEETDEEILTLELKSHPSVNYVNHLGTGKQVVMYYDINSTYGLSQVLEDPDFIDVRTGDKVNREWKYVYGILEQYNEPIYSCEEKLSVNGSYYDDCYVSGEETKDKRLWTDYPSRDIQEGKTTIGIEVDVKRNDWIDGVWNIAGLTIDKHAEWTNDLNDNLSGYWDFDEGVGTLIEQKVSLGDGGTGKDMTVTGGLGGQWGTGILGSSYFVNYSQKQPILNPYGNGSISINVWVNGTDAGGTSQGILGNYDSGAVLNKSLMGVTAAGDLYMSVHDSGSDVFGSKIGPGLTMLTATINSTHLYLYLNGTYKSSHAFGSVPVFENRWINISGFADASYNNKAVYTDELGIWTRTLTASEVTQLWNGGSGITYVPSLAVTLNIPADNAGFTTSSVEFNCSATGAAAIQNVSLYINGGRNHTITDGVETSVELHKILLFAEGKYNWTCGAADINNNGAFAENRTFSIDTTDPLVEIVYPTVNNSNWTIPTLDINFTRSDNNLASCWYSNDTYLKNTILASCGNVTDVTWSQGNHNITIWVNDTAGHEVSDGISFTIDSIPPDINITYPINNTNWTVNTVDVNYTTSDLNLYNCWYSNDSMEKNYSLATCGTNITAIIWSEGLHNVTVWANDTFGNINNSKITFTIDTTNPTVNITYPLTHVNYHRISTNLTVNYSASDAHLSSCWGSFDGGTNNISLTCADQNITRNITSVNNDTFTFWANDTLGNIGNISRTWIYKVFQYVPTFNSETSEGATETFRLNFTQGAGLQTSTVDFVYNSTLHSSTFSISSDNVSTVNSIIIPNKNSSITVPFYWSITMSDGSEINTSSYNQTINILKVDNCSSYGSVIYNFTVYDEETKVKLDNTTIEIQFELYDEAKTTRILNFSQLYEEINPARICINSSLLISVNYSADLVVKYTSNDSGNAYANEYYNILSQVIGNSTVPRNIKLYSLLDSDSTEFQLTFKDSSLAFAPNVLVYLYRQYVADNDFKVVEVPLTDSNGQTILHMVRNDIVYNLVMVHADGTILATFNKIIAFCQDYTIGSCSINLNARAEGDTVYDYTDDLGISYTTPTYSNSTKLVSFSFVSTDLSTKEVSVKVIKDTNFGNRTVCENSLTSSTGTITCNVSDIVSTDRFLFIYISVDGDLKVQSAIDVESDSAGFGIVNGAFYAFLIMLFLITMFMEDKQVLVIALVIGWAICISLGLLSGALMGAVSSGIWLIVCVVIFLWKLKKEEVG